LTIAPSPLGLHLRQLVPHAEPEPYALSNEGDLDASAAALRRKPSKTANKRVTQTVSAVNMLRRAKKLLRDLGGVLGRRFGTVEQLFATRRLGW
jgi:hypothetical protein